MSGVKTSNIGINYDLQPPSTLQLANISRFTISFLILRDVTADWEYNDTVLPFTGIRAGPGSVTQLTPNNISVVVPPNHFVLLTMPSDYPVYDHTHIDGNNWVPGKEPAFAWRIIPRTYCSGENCLVGGNINPYRGTYTGIWHDKIPKWYDDNAGWNKPWPEGGGYTICNDPPCNEQNTTAPGTILECGKDMVCDVSAVDGYNFSIKAEMSSGPSNPPSRPQDCHYPGCGIKTTIIFDPEDCPYGIRNYAHDTGLGMVGCSTTMKDGNFSSANFASSNWNTIHTSEQLNKNDKGYCNRLDVADPYLGQYWDYPCYAPSHDWCEYIHKDQKPIDPSQNRWSVYCFSHDDQRSSPGLNQDYKVKLTYGNGIVGKPFPDPPVGCNWTPKPLDGEWSPGQPCGSPAPTKTTWNCDSEFKCVAVTGEGGNFETEQDCLDNCKTKLQHWVCSPNNDGTCILSDQGTFLSEKDCQDHCALRWNCVNHNGYNSCVPQPGGHYDIEIDCMEECNKQNIQYKCVNGECMKVSPGTGQYPNFEVCQQTCSKEEKCPGPCAKKCTAGSLCISGRHKYPCPSYPSHCSFGCCPV